MSSNLELIRRTYEGSSEENGRNLLAVLHPQVEWTEAEGFPYAGTYVGVEALMAGVFSRLAGEWIDYHAQVHTYLADGDRVAAFGVYSGTYKATAKSMQAPFAHLYEIRDGKIVRMSQYVDTVLVAKALS
ncbi:nuclear transport factor 2 family protein [Acidovorax sp. NCPPB 3859]|nr:MULTISPECIES: nuclear transport factor 2 family protein [unclassified Acidovorax]MDA8449467.1 nuclear transport factor 2 family protein [Acidovorax sp. GBBC 3297]MDA8458444.1 nuclear transport factor 2 family protein [Acidovorax sp. GBBC 3333]MDA8463482.1 nuclear transport factor 2 family protein [Acidovorax sp. GBBC 3332]MDA8468647.1 nuclear transport factor 2 family protein [Acidovorax sp. GBBC 3299]WCM77003.1 nuclear transport factor 2 family protein [Acidovorax sp. GBBC 712]